MRLILLAIGIFLFGCNSNLPNQATHHPNNYDPEFRNGKIQCTGNHWYNGARCVPPVTHQSPYK